MGLAEDRGVWTNPVSVSESVNVGADLEGGTKLDVHGGHEVLLSE